MLFHEDMIYLAKQAKCDVEKSLALQWFYLAIFTALNGSHSQSNNGLYFPNFMYFSTYFPNFYEIFSQMFEKR